MKLKKELEKENRELREKIATMKVLPCGYVMDTCPTCFNNFIMTANQHKYRLIHKITFTCSLGHKFTYTS